MAEFVTPTMVRDYLTVTGTSGQWSSSVIGSNIAAASANLQRWTGRQFEPQGSNTTATKMFTTDGRAYVSIPDLRSVTTLTLQDVAQDANEGYYLIPDRMNSGVFIGVQLRAYDQRGRNFHSNPQWFDRNLDHWYWSTRDYWSLPNDLVITGYWGHVPYPDPLLHATTVLAAYYTKRPDSLLGGVSLTTQGTEVDLSALPREVQDFVRDWKLGEMVMAA